MKEYKISDIKNDCYGCQDRKVGCHDHCEKYKKYKKLINERNQKIRKQRELEDSFWTPYSRSRRKRNYC